MHPLQERPKILLVDDDVVVRKTYELVLRKVCDCTPASSAEEAMELFTAQGCDQFDAILTDYYMPGGTGLDLLCQVRMRDPTLAVVIITAKDEKELVTNSLRGGAFGYLEKGVRAEELLETMRRAVAETARQRALRDDAADARTMGQCQLAFLGLQTAVDQEQVEVFFQPLTRASGDFVSLLERPDGRLLILASDVSGHNLNAAYQSIFFQGVARGMIERGASFSEIFSFFNRFLLEGWNRSGEVQFSIAAFGAEVDPGNGLIEIMNAGFPTPVLTNESGRALRLDADASSPLGWFEELPTASFRDAFGSKLLFWSDGLDDLADTLQVDPLALAHRLLVDPDGVDSLVASARDDIIVMRKCLRDPAQETAEGSWIPIFDQRFRGDQFEEIDRLQRFFERSLEVAEANFDDERLCTVVLCMREAALNALDHGARRQADQSIWVRLALETGTTAIRLEVEDEGTGHDFDLATHEAIAGEQMLPQHRGLLFIKNLSDSMELMNQGRLIRIHFSSAQAVPA
jgi:CheY-like chemotaxis protein/anti-sigma regulatory factor (Ser/Thr protein kinase)